MEYPIHIATDILDPGDLVFDEDETPILEFNEKYHPQPGWNLIYMEADGNGGDDYWIGGEFQDLEWALSQAQKYLNSINYPWPRPKE